jgi:threonine aldolase
MPVTAFVDLRSDTVTRPTDGMRRAMAAAEVGDDVYGEDPTVNALEAEVAELFGHAVGIFVPSGTMGNQVSLRVLCRPGDEVLCDADAHVVSYEGGGLAAHGGVQTRTIVVPRGLLTREVVEPQLRSPGYHTVATSALAVEQTHNRGGGSVYPLELLVGLSALAAEHGIPVHCDGARIWNAHIASGVALAEYGALFDTMSVCLSKGLGAPIGSVVLLRDASRADEARELRHKLGGAMRQVGILAAAGRYALDNHLERLADDHERARRLAAGLADRVPGLVDAGSLEAGVETNMVVFDLPGTGPDANAVAEACRADGVLVSCVAPRRIRLVTHLDVDDEGVDRALEVLGAVLRAGLVGDRA